MKSGLKIFVVDRRFPESVHQKVQLFRIIPCLSHLHYFLDPDCPVCKEAGISLLLQLQHELHLIVSGSPVQVSQHIDSGCIAAEDVFHDIVDGMALHLFSCYRRKGAAYTCEYHSEIIIYFRACRYGRARIARIDLLLNCDSRRNALDQFYIRLGHASKELSGIRRKAFGKTPLAFRKKSIKSKGRLAGTGYAGDYHKFSTRYLDRHILEVVDLGPSDNDVPFFCHIDLESSLKSFCHLFVTRLSKKSEHVLLISLDAWLVERIHAKHVAADSACLLEEIEEGTEVVLVHALDGEGDLRYASVDMRKLGSKLSHSVALLYMLTCEEVKTIKVLRIVLDEH